MSFDKYFEPIQDLIFISKPLILFKYVAPLWGQQLI